MVGTDLDGRVCIVAGGGNGIGEAAAHALADHGATVVVNDLGAAIDGSGRNPAVAEDVAASIRSAGGDASAHFGDVSDLNYARRLIADTVESDGRLDLLANFANVVRDGYATNLSARDWDEVIRVNLRSNFALLRAGLRHWRSIADGGTLERQRSFLAATSASAFGNVGQVNYSAAKAGVFGFVRSAASEAYSTGVRVNALIPAGFTRVTETVPAEHRPYTPEEMPPEKVGPMVVFLASEAARDVTGVTVYAGGDRVAIYSDPRPIRRSDRPGGWDPDTVADFFDEAASSTDLTRTERRL